MYSDIEKNKMKTAVIVFSFLTMITIIVYFLCYFFNFGEYAIVIALSFSIITTVLTYYNCDKAVLASVNAREATKEEYLQLNNILDGLMVSSGLETRPKLYVVESAQPNAFATGRDPEHAVICVTKGLLEKLNYYELEGVIAHELSHVKNYDIRLSAVVSVMVGFVIMLSDTFTRTVFRGRRNSDNGRANIIILILGLIFLVISPIVSKLIQLAVSRRREFLADATAVSFTRNPDGLISALRKITSDESELEVASKSNDHMYIISPFNSNKKVKKSSLFSTHPSTDERVAALEKLK